MLPLPPHPWHGCAICRSTHLPRVHVHRRRCLERHQPSFRLRATSLSAAGRSQNDSGALSRRVPRTQRDCLHPSAGDDEAVQPCGARRGMRRDSRLAPGKEAG